MQNARIDTRHVERNEPATGMRNAPADAHAGTHTDTPIDAHSDTDAGSGFPNIAAGEFTITHGLNR
jgi:hypothetical protein